MFVNKIVGSFDASHSLTAVFPEGHKCCNNHGHTWGVLVELEFENFTDFTVMKQKFRDVLEIYDHKYLNDLVAFPPICELLAPKIAADLRAVGLLPRRLELSETVNNTVIYELHGHPMEAIHRRQANTPKQDVKVFNMGIGIKRCYCLKDLFELPKLDMQKYIEGYLPGAFELMTEDLWAGQIAETEDDFIFMNASGVVYGRFKKA